MSPKATFRMIELNRSAELDEIFPIRLSSSFDAFMFEDFLIFQ